MLLIFSFVVGYQNKSLRENLNYVAPTFVKVDGTKKINLQDIAMSEDVDDEMAEIMVKNEYAINTEDYYWYNKIESGTYAGKAGPDKNHRWTVPEGKRGLWIMWVYDEETGEDVEDYAYVTDREFDWGEAVVMQASGEDFTSQFSGSVTDDNLVFPLRENLNYVANPFPSAVNLQDFEMGEGVDDEMAEIMVKNEYAINTEDYYWYNKIESGTYAGKAGPDKNHRWVVPAGKTGLWIKWVYDEETGEDVEDYEYTTDKVFEPGESVVMQASGEDFTVTLLAPFDL